MSTAIVGSVVFAVLLLAVRRMVKDHAKGGCSCTGGCSGCPGSAYCHPAKKTEKET